MRATGETCRSTHFCRDRRALEAGGGAGLSKGDGKNPVHRIKMKPGSEATGKMTRTKPVTVGCRLTEEKAQRFFKRKGELQNQVILETLIDLFLETKLPSVNQLLTNVSGGAKVIHPDPSKNAEKSDPVTVKDSRGSDA